MKKELCKTAIKAMNYSYSPYSEFSVGAALLCENGKIYTGCNIENSSYSATVCAERTAVFKAVSDGARDFQMIAIAASKNGVIKAASPCGICRQVMAEFCGADFKILIVTDSDNFYEYTLGELLPEVFTLKEE